MAATWRRYSYLGALAGAAGALVIGALCFASLVSTPLNILETAARYTLAGIGPVIGGSLLIGVIGIRWLNRAKARPLAAAKGGLLVGPKQQPIDAFVGTDDTSTASSALATVGITPVTKATDVNLGALLTKLDPTGGFFGHDKVEGVATTDGGKTLVVSNDSDFGIDGIANQTAPYQLHAKILPNGTQDDGQFLAIDITKLNDPNSTATVQIFVTPKGIHVEN
jgi:hypothetical protein